MCEACRLSRRAFCAGTALALAGRPARAEDGRPVEATLRLPAGGGGPRVALTLDACPGAFDARIAYALADLRVMATIMVTGIWIRQNPTGLAFLKAHPDLFAIENHGARHVPPVFGERLVFGIQPAGDAAAVRREVEGGATAIQAAFGTIPTWYRGATGFYSPQAMPPIEGMGFRIAGYSLNGDLGASLPAAAVADRIAAAKDGDVIVAHVNQPRRASGPGVVEGMSRLRARGFQFTGLPA